MTGELLRSIMQLMACNMTLTIYTATLLATSRLAVSKMYASLVQENAWLSSAAPHMI